VPEVNGGGCMQTSIVIGAFQFVGFHLAKYLLEQGEEVLGIDWEDRSDEIVIEKEMEIGRNSNFLYIPIHKLRSISVVQPKIIYVSCYDLSKHFMEDKEEIIQQVVAFLKEVEAKQHSQIMLLLPIEENRHDYDSILQVVEKSESAKLIFLPTIYGPWQPKTMSFEAAIRQKEISEIERAIKVEDKSDALFISDVTEVLVKIASHVERRITLQSEEADQWLQCAKVLWKEDFIQPYLTSSISRTDQGFIYKVENKTAPTEGVALQKRHFQRFQRMKK
jgi:hypothetical protein